MEIPRKNTPGKSKFELPKPGNSQKMIIKQKKKIKMIINYDPKSSPKKVLEEVQKIIISSSMFHPIQGVDQIY